MLLMAALILVLVLVLVLALALDEIELTKLDDLGPQEDPRCAIIDINLQ